MSTKVSVTQIAKRSGVSKALVSRLLNNDPTLRISEQRRSQVLAVRDQLIVAVDDGEQTKRRRLARNMVVPCVGHDVFEQVQAHLRIGFFDGFRDVLKQHGFKLSLTLIEEDEGMEAFEDLINNPGYCDGLLFLVGSTGSLDRRAIAKMILERSFPHVCYDIEMEEYGLVTVYSNILPAMSNAVKHLKSLGHRNIGYVGNPPSLHYRFFCAAMGINIMTIREELNCKNPMSGTAFPKTAEGWRDIARDTFRTWLDNPSDATAMVCQNDYTALGVVDAMCEKGLEPGKDISVIGYDNIEQRGSNPTNAPFLSTIDHEMLDLGHRCGEILINQIIHDQFRIVHELLPSSFIARGSTGPCSV